MNFHKEFEKRRAGFILVEPGNSQAIRKLIVLAEATDKQSDQVRLATPTGSDEKQMVLVIGEGALTDPFHRVLQKFMAFDEDELQILWIRAAGSKYPDGFATARLLSSVRGFHI